MCLNKVPVLNKETNIVQYYPCGHCSQCINNKVRKYVSMCDNQFELSKYCLFVTPTYAPQFLPEIYVDSFKENDKYHVIQYAKTKRVQDYFGSEILEERSFDNLVSYEKYVRPLLYNKFNLDKNTFGFLFRPDVQRFIKRVRERLTNHLSKLYFNKSFKKLNQHEKAKIKIQVEDLKVFISGEYGPKTFRPHYHILLFCNYESTYDFIFNNVGSLWKFGLVDVQCATRQASNYVSGYVNSYVYTPSLLKTSFARPFSQHSLFLGVNVDKEYNKKIHENDYRTIRERLCVRNGLFQHYSYPSSLENLLYPKTYRFSCSTDYQLLRRYECYKQLSEYFGTNNVKEIVTLYLNRQHDFVWDKNDYLRNTLTYQLLIPYSENDVSTLTTMLYTSRKFLRNCKHFGLTSMEYIKLIKNYYADKDSFTLRDSLKKLSIESMITDDVSLIINSYDNIPYNLDYYFPHHGFVLGRKEHYKIVKDFAHSLGITFKKVIHSVENPQECSYLMDKFILQDKILNDNMKHKKQNDLNKIFIYEYNNAT